jgi:hypothetical protein
MIPYLEIKDQYTLKTISLVEPKEFWLELSYQDVGEFEVYCRASTNNLLALKKGRYVKMPNKRFIWVITSVQYTDTENGERMILAKGYEAKWLLKKRCILTPKELQGTITTAVYGLVNANAGTAANSQRAIEHFTVDSNALLIDISGTQAPRGNLLEFVNSLLKTYNCGAQVIFDNGKLKYCIFTGAVKTQSVRFSQSLDNLLSSDYLTDDEEKVTSPLVVSEVDGVEYTARYETGAVGVDRAEMVIESNISTKYIDANGVEQETTPNSALYSGWLVEECKTAIATHTTIEEINGEIDVTNSIYNFDEDFFVGDLVHIQNEYFDFSANQHITKYTFKQDVNGYNEEAKIGGK